MGVEPTAPILGRLCATIALLPQVPSSDGFDVHYEGNVKNATQMTRCARELIKTS